MIKKLLLTILLLTAPLTTHAYFSDEEVSGAIMSAGRIAFTMSATTTSLAPSATSFTFAIDDESTQTPNFSVGTASTTCSGVTFTATQNQFSGEHTVGIQGAVANCAVTIVTEAWQQNFTQGQGGFTASSTLTFTFTDPNAPQPTATVVLNEIYANASSTASEWVEIYNAGTQSVDLNGWSVREGTKTPQQIISTCDSAPGNRMAPLLEGGSTEIVPGGYLAVRHCVGNRLVNTGSSIELYDSSSTVVSTTTYVSLENNETYSRIPNSENWGITNPTPGAENIFPVAPSAVRSMKALSLDDPAITLLVDNGEEEEKSETDSVEEVIAEEAIKEDEQIVVEPDDEPLIEEVVDDPADADVEEKADDEEEVSESEVVEEVEEEAEEEAVEEPEEKAQEDAVEEIEEEVQEEVVQEVVEEVVEEVEQEAAAPVVAGEKFEG
ncbi:hypothetical protein A3C89_04240 [Candidatus Kaiserbacteria bacterium RIFCSPHIGHO2_02_FULL_50_50]|uniref:LTD domain-containing protein n=1 Tax=Candidatus Kaiserbacteria bacterium RIFCSPHIGHO2_02_FULL_50_50 TaxID=1798492 RepID=A0A1F6DDS7_9BACT|nr:MAG: hypothetical protein A3C89_04240 [Candidatus Kaiserbacteria bacterium RIFCSPHIGHO2_02_FULL_50_50]OGG89060.1 MAG: hypothetical protein A3G62_03980 [Candidatus Kaiserbacteria bacterium RIFCSPLOWO2_12_FULL_50_10]